MVEWDKPDNGDRTIWAVLSALVIIIPVVGAVIALA